MKMSDRYFCSVLLNSKFQLVSTLYVEMIFSKCCVSQFNVVKQHVNANVGCYNANVVKSLQLLIFLLPQTKELKQKMIRNFSAAEIPKKFGSSINASLPLGY